jgi:signal transduction histidine kinase
VVAIDPGMGNPVPPPVVVEEAWANQLPIPLDGQASIPAGNNTFDFRFTGLSLSTPEKLRFKYRLEPYDADWMEAGPQRTAHYTNMDPREYRFRVIAQNSFGVWNLEGASVRFVLRPHFYQTKWFYVVAFAPVAALVWAVYLFRIRQLQHTFNLRLRERLDERTRIARELHDTLLQSFHGLLLRFQTAASLLPADPVRARQTLDDAIARAAQAVTEGRDAVQGLRAATAEQQDLAVAIKTLGDDLATDVSGQARPAFAVAVEGSARALHAIVRDEVYKIAAEALRNAFRHAQATRVEVEIRYDDGQVRLRVRDNGRGIDPAVLASLQVKGHYGLPGIQERAATIGGTLAVWSEPGTGTEVELCIPAATVYAAGERRSRLGWLFRPQGRRPT